MLHNTLIFAGNYTKLDFQSFEKIIKTENSARNYLLGFCWKNHQRFCPKCRSRKLYALQGDRRRCARCAYTFHDFSQRFLNNGNLTARQWLRVIKLFELEVPTSRMAEQLGVSYNTAHKAATTLRLAIVGHSRNANSIFKAIDGLHWTKAGKFHLDMRLTSGGITHGRMPVLGIAEQETDIFVDLIQDINADTILDLKINFNLKTSSIGKIIYTDSFRNYASLIIGCGGNTSLCNIKHTDKGIYIDSVKGFWSFSKDWFRKIKGISPRNLPLYMKELEFRYNHRNKDMFPVLAACLCARVPDFED